jgi:hypothetical protein
MTERNTVNFSFMHACGLRHGQGFLVAYRCEGTVMQGGGAAWKGAGMFTRAPSWVQAVMRENFKSPAGALAVAGLMGLPLWLWYGFLSFLFLLRLFAKFCRILQVKSHFCSIWLICAWALVPRLKQVAAFHQGADAPKWKLDSLISSWSCSHLGTHAGLQCGVLGADQAC